MKEGTSSPSLKVVGCRGGVAWLELSSFPTSNNAFTAESKSYFRQTVNIKYSTKLYFSHNPCRISTWSPEPVHVSDPKILLTSVFWETRRWKEIPYLQEYLLQHYFRNLSMDQILPPKKDCYFKVILYLYDRRIKVKDGISQKGSEKGCESPFPVPWQQKWVTEMAGTGHWILLACHNMGKYDSPC